MNLEGFRERYDSFQKPAVSAIERDFSKKRNGRYLLVIPTGGGKTFTAVKAVNRLFENNILQPDSDKVLWTAHRIELLDQAKDTFREYGENDAASYENKIIFQMISGVPQKLSSESSIKLIVIDEAHHGAANSYKPIFDNNSIGILGLTATPSRHDGKPLDFERESFSIGFPDLVKKGIILKPEIRYVKGGRYDFKDFDDDDLETLNNDYRNQKIINELLKNIDTYKKVIVYVGTKKHCEDLFKILLDTPLNNKYESISYIVGNKNSRNQIREEFIETEKKFGRSILVNVQVLSEGYDDPSVNTIVMASPSKSKLYYMQALGRAVRINPNDMTKKAYVVEVVDDLPNIRYRIDNRWLYADISDVLEPAVEDNTFSNVTEFNDVLDKLFIKFNIPSKYRSYPEYDEDNRYSILLFKQYTGLNSYKNFPVIISRKNRIRVSNMFNFISERMANFVSKRYNCEAVFKMLGADGIDLIENKNHRRLIFDAMTNASLTCTKEDDTLDEFIHKGYPWIAFVALHYRKKKVDIPEEWLEFTKEMVNKDEIIELLTTKNYEKGSVLVRLPLPLASYIGKILTNNEFIRVKNIISELKTIKSEKGMVDHLNDVDAILGNAILPIKIMHSSSLSLIARENIEYYLHLT